MGYIANKPGLVYRLNLNIEIYDKAGSASQDLEERQYWYGARECCKYAIDLLKNLPQVEGGEPHSYIAEELQTKSDMYFAANTDPKFIEGFEHSMESIDGLFALFGMSSTIPR